MIEILTLYGWGRMFINKTPSPYPGENWGFDNGAFICWQNGKPFDEVKYMKRLEIAYTVSKPYLAVAPDIVGEGEKSLNYSIKWIDKLPPWPWYLAVQDGMTTEMVEDVINQFSGIFLGGTNKFKSTAYGWRVLAHKHGKKFHYGRAGTPRKIDHAIAVGSDSADSAFPLWTYDRMHELIKHINGPKQMSIWDEKTISRMGG